MPTARIAPWILLTVLAAGPLPAAALGDGSCNAWLSPQVWGTLAEDELGETSGIAASHAQPDVLWLHNDSGGNARLYATGLLGEVRGSYLLLGVDNVDWEDVALGPCDDAEEQPCSCLYVADIGDNAGTRGGGVIHRVPEPEVVDGALGGQVSGVEELWFRYPDGAHDAEALVVHPFTGETVVLTKAGADGLTLAFAFPDAPPLPAPESAPVTLVQVGGVDVRDLGATEAQVTGADLSPRGRRLVLRTDDDLLLLTVPDGGGPGDALSGAAELLPVPDEGRGEAVAFLPDGDGVVLVAEGVDATLWAVRCSTFDPDGEGDWDPLVDCDDPPGCGCSAAGRPRAEALALLLLLLGAVRRSAGHRSAGRRSAGRRSAGRREFP